MKVEMDRSIDVQKALDFARGVAPNPPQVREDGSINLDNYKHGDIVEVDGVAGIVIDREKKLRDIAENDDELGKMRTLLDPTDPTFSMLDPAVEKNDEFNEVMNRYLDEHPDTKMKRAEVQKAFSGWDIAGNGELVPSNDPRAKLYAEAMAKVRSGEVRLPTVEEYEKQEKEARERQIQRANQHLTKQKEVTKQQVTREQTTDEVVPVPSSNNVIEMEEMHMSAEDRQKAIRSAKDDPMIAAIYGKKMAEVSYDIEDEAETWQDTHPVTVEHDDVSMETDNEPSSNKEAPPIDLFAAKERLDEMHDEIEQDMVEDPEEEKQPDLVINVPAEKADTFVENLKPRTNATIQTARKITVNFTKDLKLPKATKRIVNIDAYRSVAPKNVSADVTPRILINSGYIGYFNPCGALKWSRLAPVYNPETRELGDLDQAKVIQFCYEQLATTSIGNLSYRQFLENTSIDDLSAMLHAIMGASLPDEQEVVMTCGKCEKEFETKYSIADLPDYDSMSEETMEQVQKIQAAKDMIEDARDVHDESPVMQLYCYQADSTGTMFIIKHSDLSIVIDRQSVTRQLTDRYGTSAALLSLVIPEVRIKTGNTGTDDDWSSSNDPMVICEELLRISTENLGELKAITGEIPMIEPITYTIKGTRTCANCGATLGRFRQDINSLVFQVALKAQYFV